MYLLFMYLNAVYEFSIHQLHISEITIRPLFAHALHSKKIMTNNQRYAPW